MRFPASLRASLPLLLLLALTALPRRAAAAGNNDSDMVWVKATVVTDGAAVYAKPDFDSPVQDYIGFKTSVLVSKKPYAGLGGLGLFHRIRYANKMGFIPDTDIRAAKQEQEKGSSEEKKKSSSKAWSDDEEKDSKKLGKGPVYYSRYIGGAVSLVNFSEKFSGHKLTDNIIMYGLRMTGPGTLFDGPPIDFNLWFSVQKPGYYVKFDAGPPKGFLVFGDMMVLIPMVETRDFIINYGLGIMYTYTHYNVPVRSAASGEIGNFDSEEFRVGADFGIGLAQRMGKFLFRLDAKYYIEKTTYPGFIASFQMEY